jgi:hypothetical protein
MGNLPTLESESGDYFLFNLSDCADFWTKSPEMAVGSRTGGFLQVRAVRRGYALRRLSGTFCPEIRQQEIGV